MDEKPSRLKHILAGFKSLFIQPPDPPAPTEPPSQKRKRPRMLCEYRVEGTVEKKKFGATVTDISGTGMRLEVTRTLPAGAVVGLRFDPATVPAGRKPFERDTVQARVMWCRKRRRSPLVEAGVEFVEDQASLERSWVRHLLSQLGIADVAEERRRYVRTRGELAAEALPLDGAVTGFQGTIRNMGAGGCLFRGKAAFRLQTRIKIKMGPRGDLPALSVEARVLRCERTSDGAWWDLGVEFGSMRSKDLRLLGRYVASLLASEA